MKISLDKIEEFREEVNRDKFVLSKYKNVNGKNQWGCICSAMDWITVAIEYLNSFESERRKRIQSMEMFAFISSIDVVWEGIQQLHRVIFSDTKKIPFDGRFECFSNRIYEGKDDNTYFKEIRASFGAHPVNLQGENGEKLFASWSGSFDGGEFSVLLYSNTPEKPFKKMGIRMGELCRFLEERYNYLDILENELRKQREMFFLEMRKKKIQRSDDVVKQLIILKDEISQRNNCDYDNYVADILILIFDISILSNKNKEMVDRYRQRLVPLVESLYSHVQNMESADIDTDLIYSRPSSLSPGYAYWIEKISEYVWGAGYPPAYWEKELKTIFADKFDMEYDSYEELYVLIQACMSELK